MAVTGAAGTATVRDGVVEVVRGGARYQMRLPPSVLSKSPWMK